MLVKARRGFAARHIYRAHDADELAFFLRYTTAESMVQAFCTGEEFSIDLISDLSGRCLEAVPRSMIESKGGETIKGESLDDAALRDVAVRVAETLGIKGPACVQCFRDGDDASRDGRQRALRRGLPGARRRGRRLSRHRARAGARRAPEPRGSAPTARA